MAKMRSLKSKVFRYEKQNIEPGQVFEVKKRGDVTLFSRAKIAEVVDEKPKAQAKAKTATKARAAAAKGPARKKTSVSAAGTYNRRDMKAKT